MAKRELSSTLRNLKFMQRAVQREEKPKKEEEEVKLDANFGFSSTIVKKRCVVIMEGDPHPGAVKGRMSFQSFNPSIDKLNEEALNRRQPEVATSSGDQHGGTSIRENGSTADEVHYMNEDNPKSDVNGDLKRKQPAEASEAQYPNKSPKNNQRNPQASPGSSKSSYKQPKRDKLDWSVLRPPKSQEMKVPDI